MSDRSARERDHFDSLAEETGSVWWGAKTRAGQMRLDERAALAIGYADLGPGKTVLEPGAGNAEFTWRLALSGATIAGVEISPRQVDLGNARLQEFPHAELVKGDISCLQFADGFFDAVVGNSVLHHFTLETALPEIRRVLKRGGWLWFSEPNMVNPQIAVEKNVKWVGRRLQNSPDETAFFRWRIKKILERHGFERVVAKPFDFLHPGTPERLIPWVRKMSHMLERFPIIGELGGSLQIMARG
jgi:ubiquinone/menaquinone biosynthesis C-methylase UbiE